MILIIALVFVASAYFILISAFALGLRRAFDKKQDCEPVNVKLSLVVAFKDEEKNLPVLLNALLGQTLSQEFFELVFVDDHSSDQSFAVVNSYYSSFRNVKVVVLPAKSAGKKAALTYGISLSSNPFVVFTDADCLPTKFWLESISNISANGSDFLVGAVVMHPINSFSRRIQSLEYSSLMATLVGSCGIGHPVIASSANLAFRKDCLNIDVETMCPKVESGDDMFLLHQAKRIMGCRIEFMNDPNSAVQTLTEPTISKALIQRRRWASKAIHYKDFDTIFVGLVVLLFNVALVVLLLASVFNVIWLYLFLILIILKSITDYSLIASYLKFTQQEKLLRIFLPLQLIYPFYIIYSFFMGLLIKSRWKGRVKN